MKWKVRIFFSHFAPILLATIVAIIVFLPDVHAQQIEQNQKGDWILINKDGSTRILNPANKSDLKLLNTEPAYVRSSFLTELADKITQDLKESENKIQLNNIESERLRINRDLLEQTLKTEKAELGEAEINQTRKQINELKIIISYLKKENLQYQNDIENLKSLLKISGPKQIEAYRTFCAERNKKHKPPPVLNNPNIKRQVLPNAGKSIDNIPPDSRPALKDYARYVPTEDVMVKPPVRPCQIEFEGEDEFMGKRRKDHAAQVLFFYTPAPLTKNYPDSEYLTCKAALSVVSGGSMFLNLYFYIAVNDAGRLFGGFEKGSIINLKFLDGDNIAIINNRNDPGLYDPVSKTMMFRAQCNLGAAAQDKISSKSLDKIRVTWQTGYEDYDVFDVDSLMRQAKCIQ